MIFKTLLTSAAVSLAVASYAQAAVQDGTFEGTANGKNGPVTVAVTIKAGKITNVKVVKSGESAMIGDAAIARIPSEIVARQSLRVNNVAGATLSSMAIQAAATNAVKAAGGTPNEFYKAPIKKSASNIDISYKTAVVVVGSGASGMAAAVRSQLNGNPTILIEKMPYLGGDTILNAGTLIATGSRYQRDVMKEIKDSPELAYKDIMHVGKNRNDPVLVKMVTEKAGSVVDWLIDDLKIPYGPAATQYPDHSASRQLGVTGRSPNFIRTMARIFTDHGGKILMETRATSLIYKGGRVNGVQAVNADGDKITINAKETILASGGFGADESFLTPGRKQIAAGYVMYSPQTILTLTVGNGVFMFTLNLGTGEYILTKENIRIPVQTQEFAINMSNMRHWEAPVQKYVQELLAGDTGPLGKNFNMRWVAAMVAEVHRVLCRGGIFMYPRDNRDPSKPGKLRLMYEANPMSFLIEQAGGKATNGYQNILDLQPEKLHQRVAVFLGSAEEVERVTSYHE